MSEDGTEERETAHKTWLSEKVTSLETENAELKKALRDMEERLALQENAMRQAAERFMAMDAAIWKIAEHAQRQDNVAESSRVSIQGLVDEVNIHRNNFQNVVMIMQIHEQYIVWSGVVTQEMAQHNNALVRDNQNKNVWIENLMKELRGRRISFCNIRWVKKSSPR